MRNGKWERGNERRKGSDINYDDGISLIRGKKKVRFFFGGTGWGGVENQRSTMINQPLDFLSPLHFKKVDGYTSKVSRSRTQKSKKKRSKGL